MTDTVNKALQKRKNDRTRARVVSQARKVQDKVSIKPKDPSYYPKEVLTDSERKQLQKAFFEKPNVTYRTQGKQKLLSGGKAGGMSYIFKEMKRRLMKGTPGTSSKTY